MNPQQLSLPGWGAPGRRWMQLPTDELSPARQSREATRALERLLCAETAETLRSITNADVARKHHVPYSRARAALRYARAKARTP